MRPTAGALAELKLDSSCLSTDRRSLILPSFQSINEETLSSSTLRRLPSHSDSQPFKGSFPQPVACRRRSRGRSLEGCNFKICKACRRASRCFSSFKVRFLRLELRDDTGGGKIQSSGDFWLPLNCSATSSSDIPDHIGNLIPLQHLHGSEFLQGSSEPVHPSDWWRLNISISQTASWTITEMMKNHEGRLMWESQYYHHTSDITGQKKTERNIQKY